ncbi:MAG TPA: heavy metal-binding domain-containing protein, partial [Actinomycetota bacterium]|nr:heavy metal-binding domain-containing protein [Actinomycetota bacterium]
MPIFHHKDPTGRPAGDPGAPGPGAAPPGTGGAPPAPGATPDPAREAAELAASLAALERGGIPPKAERRLAELRQGDRTLFTSDLSVSEFALITKSGLTPVSQVMGSSVYHVGWQGTPMNSWGYGRGAYQLGVLSEAWNNARGLALSRLQQEAKLAGADAVVGVHIEWGAHDFAPNSVEMVAVGTAVRTRSEQRTDPPVLTDLSGQEVYALLSAGFRPVGIVGATTVFYVVPQWGTQQLTGGWSWGSWANAELPDFTQAFYAAREAAFGALNGQAAALGAHGIIGVKLSQNIATREIDQGGGKRLDLIITLHVLGTGIVEGPGGSLPISTNLDL